MSKQYNNQDSSEASLAIINIVNEDNNQENRKSTKKYQQQKECLGDSKILSSEKENMASFGNLKIFSNTFENRDKETNIGYQDNNIEKQEQHEPSLPFCDFQSFNYTGSSQFDMQTTPCLKSVAGTLPQTSR